MKTQYPCIKRGKESGQIVLFVKPKCGFCLESKFFSFMHYCESWYEPRFELVKEDNKTNGTKISIS